MEEEKLSHEESMELITRMINQAKNYYYESGLGSMLWGFTNFLCFTLAWFEVVFEFRFPVTPFVLLVVALIVQIYYDRQERKTRRARTYMEDALHHVWASFGIAIAVLTIFGAIAEIGYVTLPMILILFGMPTFTTGRISNFPVMVIGGIVCWAFAILAFLYQGPYAFLLCAGAAVVSWLIPGLMLRAEYKKHLKEGSNK